MADVAVADIAVADIAVADAWSLPMTDGPALIGAVSRAAIFKHSLGIKPAERTY